MKTTIANIGEY